MDSSMFLDIRQLQQGLIKPNFKSPHQVLKHFGAIQGQDDPGSRWAMGLRIENGTESVINEALNKGAILRTWLMRGTLAFVPPEDVVWMLKLLAPRTLSGRAQRRKNLNLSDLDLQKCHDAFREALSGGNILSREEMYKVIGATGLPEEGHHCYHVLSHWALEGLICFGPKRDKQDTFVLLEDWAPNQVAMSESDALTELAKRYFISRGPATLQDFMWWSGLKSADAQKALAGALPNLSQMTLDGKKYWFASDAWDDFSSKGQLSLLPGFDEYVLGYKDRSPFLGPEHAQKICPGNNGMFLSTVVSKGRIVGTWKRTFAKQKVTLSVTGFDELSPTEQEEIDQQAKKYGHFLGCPSEVRYT